MGVSGCELADVSAGDRTQALFESTNFSFNCQVLHVVVEAFVIGVAESLHVLERRAHIHGGIIHCFKMFPSVLLSIKKLKSKSDKSVSEVPISPSWENAP